MRSGSRRHRSLPKDLRWARSCPPSRALSERSKLNVANPHLTPRKRIDIIIIHAEEAEE